MSRSPSGSQLLIDSLPCAALHHIPGPEHAVGVLLPRTTGTLGGAKTAGRDSLAWGPVIDPASEEVDLILRPDAIARHRAVLELGENPGGGVPDVVIGPEVEVRLHRVPVLLPE